MREASVDELEILSRLHATIVNRSKMNGLRSRFVEAEERLRETGFTIPPGMERLQVALNWPAKVVSAFAARQVPEFFTTRTETTLLDDIEDVYTSNNFHAVERWAIEAADQHGCAFVFVTAGDVSAGEPEFLLSARTALTATAELDPRSRQVKAAMEIVGSSRVVLHLPYRSLECVRRPGGWWVEDEHRTSTSMVLCAPYVHGGSLEKPLGRSRVTNTIMDLTYAGARTLLRQEVAAEFFSAPRLALMGADQSVFTDPTTGRQVSPLELLTGAIWAIPDMHPEDEPEVAESAPSNMRANLEQVTQMSMQPFSDQFRLLAASVSGAGSIPLQYLGVVQDSNPTSAEAIEAQEVDLVREVRAQNPSLGMGRRTLAVAILHAIHGDLSEDQYAEIRSLTPRWEDPRTRSMSEQSQMVALQVQAGNLQPGTHTTLRQLPIPREDITSAVAENERAAGGSIMAQILERGETQQPTGRESSEPQSQAEQDAERARMMKDQFDALGVAVRAGVDPEDAARRLGLEGIQFTGAVPSMLRMPESEVAKHGLEGDDDGEDSADEGSTESQDDE